MPGRWMLVGIERSGRHDLLDLDHADLAAHRRRRVEVARGLAEDQVAGVVRLPGLDDRQVGDDAAFQDVGLPVELLVLLALGDHRADAGLGVEAGNARAAGAHALGQRALRVEFELEFARQVLAHELGVLADVGRDHLLDLPRVCSSMPRPKSSTPALFEATVRSLTPLSADRRRSGSRGCRTGRSRRRRSVMPSNSRPSSASAPSRRPSSCATCLPVLNLAPELRAYADRGNRGRMSDRRAPQRVQARFVGRRLGRSDFFAAVFFAAGFFRGLSWLSSLRRFLPPFAGLLARFRPAISCHRGIHGDVGRFACPWAGSR